MFTLKSSSLRLKRTKRLLSINVNVKIYETLVNLKYIGYAMHYNE